MADFVRSLPFLTETSDTFPVKFRVNRVNSGGAGGAAAEPANCGGWWKLRAALGKGRPRFHLLPNALLHNHGHRSPSLKAPSTPFPRTYPPAHPHTLPHPSTAHPCPAGPHLPGAGWRHPASFRTQDECGENEGLAGRDAVAAEEVGAGEAGGFEPAQEGRGPGVVCPDGVRQLFDSDVPVAFDQGRDLGQLFRLVLW